MPATSSYPCAIDWDTARYRTGHGHVGWTTACDSAPMLADMVDERRPDIDPARYSPMPRICYQSSRYQHTR